MAVLFYLPNAAPVASGNSYPGAKLYFYTTGTSTNATVYTDGGLTTAHAQPVVADSAGVFEPIYLDPTVSYRVVLKTTSGATLRDVDPFPAAFSDAESVGEILWPRSAAEISASITPSDYAYPVGDVRRYGADPSGVTDSTVAIASAIASGSEVYIPEGTFLASSIVVDVNGLAGKTIRGASVTNTILKASASATNFFRVVGAFDFGTLSGYYNQYNVLENFTIDMTLMANSANSRGLYMSDNWGASVRNVNVKNQPASGSSLYVGPTTYTTCFDNCDFGSVAGTIRLIGASGGAFVTTLTFTGCSFARCIADYASSVTFMQAIVQGDLDKFELTNVYGCTIIGSDIEGTGNYLEIGTNVNGLVSINNALIGFTGTYSTGTMVSGYLMDQTNAPFTLMSANGTTVSAEVNGAVTEESSVAALTRKVIENTNVTAQVVDIELSNVDGTMYAGINAAGDTYVDNRGTGKLALQQSGVDRLGVTAAGNLLVGTATSATAGAGAAGAPPGTVSGYLVINIGATAFKVPYYANA